MPEFESPPAVEIAIAVSFQAMSGLSVADLGVVWNESFRGDFPTVRERPYLPPSLENFGPPTPGRGGLRIESGPATPRLWLLSDDERSLLQLQRDHFVFNWRKMEDEDVYPHYASLAPKFEGHLTAFQQFAEAHGQELLPTQAEVTYVNHLLPSDVFADHGDLDALLATLRAPEPPGFLPKPEAYQFAAHYLIPGVDDEPIGRLHVECQPSMQRGTGASMYALTLTARGVPVSRDLVGVLGFLDVGHEWIVRGFAELTTSEAHRIWRRTE